MSIGYDYWECKLCDFTYETKCAGAHQPFASEEPGRHLWEQHACVMVSSEAGVWSHWDERCPL